MPLFRTQGSTCRAGLRNAPFRLLQVCNDLEQIAGLRIATRPEHAHLILSRAMSDIAQLRKSDCRIDEISKDHLPGFDIAGEKILNALAQKRLAKTGITLNVHSDGFLRALCQGHGESAALD
jgi:hypothetical protein